MERYYYKNNSDTLSYAFNFSVYDSNNIEFALCETTNEEDAQRICDALNLSEKISSLLRESVKPT
tara:strand:- start:1090 stop:1284 length:195 start_codon:yes stop_codon:yes gene_type:complete